MLVRVLARGAIAAADVSAREAQPRFHPRLSEAETLLTAGRSVRDVIGRRLKVLAGLLHTDRIVTARGR
jgi:hypothetical protein